MKYRNLYDQYGNITDEVVKEGEKYPSNRRLPVAAIVIENDEKKLLIQKRSVSKDGVWSFTSGHIENSENSVDGIIRETEEELGIELNSNQIIEFNSGINEKYIFYSYYTKKNIELETLKLEFDEVEDARWLSLNEIDELIKNGSFKKSHINIFNDYLKYFNINCELHS